MYSDKYVLKLFLGLIFLQILVKFLKKLFKESRPIKSNTYGLPSTKICNVSPACKLGFTAMSTWISPVLLQIVA